MRPPRTRVCIHILRLLTRSAAANQAELYITEQHSAIRGAEFSINLRHVRTCANLIACEK